MANHHGDFIWYELMTPDADGAQAFYERLLGWSFHPGPGDRDYRVIAMGEAGVGGILPWRTDDRMPPAWLGYIAVDDVDAMAKSVGDAGGAVLMAPWEIAGVGWMALLADPQGTSFYVMRGESDEESLAYSYDRPRPGHCAWNELATSDPAGALRFYGQRFGWVKDGEMDMPEGKYEFLRHAGRAPEGSPMGQGMVGAVMPLAQGGPPRPAWTFYFRVPDLDAALAHIAGGGGTVTQEPVEIPGGDYAMTASDPQGAHFGLVGARGGGE